MKKVFGKEEQVWKGQKSYTTNGKKIMEGGGGSRSWLLWEHSAILR